jgi:hypothetical protein
MGSRKGGERENGEEKRTNLSNVDFLFQGLLEFMFRVYET